uniref:NEDD8-activating enzyme E1 regulatory subunit n=1 Tax=Panagrolaimus superbus TaxID=310955 RepID=A0A914YHK8_9BILA
MTSTNIRYDRQIRLWGEEGQASIQNTNVCVLGSRALASETLKNLVLPGINSFHIIDDAKVDITDLGHNFFLTKKDIGEPRAKVIARYLNELNPNVTGSYTLCSPTKIVVLSDLLKFSIVIATNLTTAEVLPISTYLYENGVPFINARVCGLFGYCRLSFRHHAIYNCQAEHAAPDMRLDRPFAALLEMESANNLNTMSHQDHAHTPYLLLIMKALNNWRTKKNDSSAFPDNYQQRKEIINILMDMRMPNDKGTLDEENFDEAKAAIPRVLVKTTIPSSVREVFAHEYCKIENLTEKTATSFWVLAAALKVFVERHDALPLSGQLPDMTSDSERYTKLLNLYRAQASQDAKEVFSNAVMIMKGIFDDDEIISFQECQKFCKQAAFIGVQNGTSLIDENNFTSVLSRITEPKLSEPPRSVHPFTWLVLLKALDSFYDGKRRFPGTNGVPRSMDAEDLCRRLEDLVLKTEDPSLLQNFKTIIPKEAIDEICRYGAAEPHVIASIIGGIVSQEAIKLVTHQYVPVNNTFIYDGHTQASEYIRM